MKIETHTPDWQDPNAIAAFVRHSSKPNGKADQAPTQVMGPHRHPDLGLVVTIVVNAAKDGNKANTVITHIPIKTLSQWVTNALPDMPKVGADISTTGLDFSDMFDDIQIPNEE
ncbi:hypothetical protein [Pseudooctadecabacter jejudonensis]|uniref:Uncharacterized protein n=1 Tax=Pseudooctadecabacter jejudonensis TaxID=1391910 RepID=A0A1Y5TML5_9RHOB|nr:hypothetical protein [Pseudooctadecabacter jejudonensis]SLN63888.1 hypothetical protein PSJ8397_03374 [Pseudooctadecabacter jejudonensis]